MTDDLVEICTKIYNNNREALDLIFTNKEDLASKFATYLKDALVELANEEDHVVIYKDDYDSGNTYIRFRYTELDKYLPMSPDQNNDVWKKNNKDEVQKTRYFFEIHPIELKTNEEKCPMYRTICRNNLSDDDESLNNAKKIIDWRNTNASDKEIWITEFGWDTNLGSTKHAAPSEDAAPGHRQTGFPNIHLLDGCEP